VQQKVLYDNPNAAAVVFPQTSGLKSCLQLVDEYFGQMTNLAPATLVDRKRHLKMFTDWVGPRPLSRELVEQFNKELHVAEWAPSTRWICGRSVIGFLNWLSDSGRMADLRKGIKFPKQPAQVPRPNYTADEVRKLIDAAEDRPIGFIILLAYNTGMAITDCCNLTWKSVDMGKLTITRNRQKTGVEAIISVKFGSELHRALERQREDTIRAFNSCDPGLPVCRWGVNNKCGMSVLFKRLAKKAGVEYKSFHSFRGTLLTDLASSNVPMNVALKIAGLRSVQQLANYAQTPAGAVREYMEKLRA
jgi:integrase